MFNFLKKLRRVKINQEEQQIQAKELKSFELNRGLDDEKYIIKEDAKIMSIPCDYKNVLPQALLKIDKSLIQDPDAVAAYINLSHFDSVDTIEEGVIEYPEIENPCGTGTIVGQAYLEKVIIVGGVSYSILLYDTTGLQNVYTGEVEYKTAYSLYKVLPLGQEVVIDPAQLRAVFTTELKRLDDIPGVNYYLYTVDGTVDLVYDGPLVIVPEP